MTVVTGSWITDPGTDRVMSMLENAGFQAWFVGGCVRDALAGKQVGDIDLTTDAPPKRVMELATAAGLKAIPTGVEHGTVTVIADRPYEITTFRRDIETDGRRAVVAFSDNLEEDAMRRDLTINAIYADRTGLVRDPVGGVADLRSKHIRFIGDAESRIREDYLRSLRYFRFYARFGDPSQGPDEAALAAIASNLAGLDTVSKERVGSEVVKLLAIPDVAPALATMAVSGVLAQIIPGADVRSIGPLIHLEAGLPPNPFRRLAALTHDDPTQSLRLSRSDSGTWKKIAKSSRNMMPPGEAGYRFGAQIGRDIVLVSAALMAQEVSDRSLDAVAIGSESRFPLKAVDLAPLEGPALGRKLRELESQWIASGFVATKQDLLG